MLKFEEWQEGKVTAVTPLAIKKGQKDLIAALSLRIEGMMSNAKLDEIYPGLRQLLFTKPSTAPKDTRARQEGLEGVPPQSDTPSISEAGQKIGQLQWGDEQSGCTCVLDYGTGGPANITLDSCVQKKLAFQALEGGVKFWFTLNTSTGEELDTETYGRVAKLKKRKIRFTLVGPKIDQLPLDDKPQSVVTPIQALAGADTKARGQRAAATA